MKKVELLSPVGNIESMYQAIHNGCDAIYLGGKKFGARSYANNFTDEELIFAIKYCHLYNVKIYITVNTIIYNEEIDAFLNYIKFLYTNNVDAIIMQDIGMISKVKKIFPNIEIHASTQMHNYNQNTIKLLEQLGIKRVVFARELSLNEINDITTNMEKEVFIHGALCLSYSGCCLFSSMNGGRSANRGECVGSCRLKYEFIKENTKFILNDKYLLSTRDLNTINYVDELLKSDIASLKIEGRMKSPEYVGFVTKIYREAIDSYYEGKKYVLSEENLNKMKLLYNREYTKGYLFNESNYNIMNIKSSNHQGIELGKIINIDKKYIKILLYEDINQGDGIRFVEDEKGLVLNKIYDEKYLLVSKIKKNNILILDNKMDIRNSGLVLKTLDISLIKELKKFNCKKIKIDIKIETYLNKKIKVTIFDQDNNCIEKSGNLILPSINVPVTTQNIIKQFSKLGNTPFELRKIDIYKDENIFISLAELNELRRNVISSLIDLRQNMRHERKQNEIRIFNSNKIIKEKKSLNILIRTEEQLKAALELNVDNIYITNYDLYIKYKNKNTYFVLDRVVENKIDFSNENLLIRDLGNIYKYNSNNTIVSDYTLNVINNESIKLLENLNIKRVCLSVEIKPEQIKMIHGNNIEMIVYGKVELMISKCNIIDIILNKKNNKCNINDKYYLQNSNRLYPIINNENITSIYSNKEIDYIENVDDLKKYINNFRIELFDENYEETMKIIKKTRRKICI